MSKQCKNGKQCFNQNCRFLHAAEICRKGEQCVDRANCPCRHVKHPMFHAAETGNLPLLLEQLRKGVDINVRDEAQCTPLHWASKNNRAEITAALLTQGADLEARNSFGQTPLIQACFFGHIEPIRSLLASGADVNAAMPLPVYVARPPFLLRLLCSRLALPACM